MESRLLEDKWIHFLGKLAGMSRRDATHLVRRHGAKVARSFSANVNLMIIGEASIFSEEWIDALDETTREAFEEDHLEIWSETQLWEKLGMVEARKNTHPLYTPAMLAELVGVPVSIIRRWHRRGLIEPTRQVKKLPYFDYHEVATARRLAQMLEAGMSPESIEKKIAAVQRFLPEVQRPLAQLSVMVEGKNILLRQGDGLIEPGGQRRFDFEALEPPETELGMAEAEASHESTLETSPVVRDPEEDRLAMVPEVFLHRPPEEKAFDVASLCEAAWELEEAGHLEASLGTYRTALLAGGPEPSICFQVAELLYRLGDLAGARERYYMTIELDEDYVEARANLGCVLSEIGEWELAVSVFEGALRSHPEYTDVHYHLGKVFQELGKTDRARHHWLQFLEMAPGSPWGDRVRQCLGKQEMSSMESPS